MQASIPTQKTTKDVDGMEHLARKQNRLSDYDYSTNDAYFVTICTQDRKKILSEIVGDGFPVPKTGGETPLRRIFKSRGGH